MLMSINCILLGDYSLRNTFSVNVCDINPIGTAQVNYDVLKIDDLKYLIWNKKKDKFGDFNSGSINIWKVNIAPDDIAKLKDVIEEQIKDNFGGEELIPVRYFKRYFQEVNTENIQIIVVFAIVSTSKVNTGHVHVFVDNSNLYVEAKYSVGQIEKIYDRVKITNEVTKVEEYRQVYHMRNLKIDYGCLLTTTLNGRTMGSSPIIVGSRPPPNDTLWDKIKDLGYEVTVYDRNNENKEKRADMKLGISMVIQTLLKAKGPGILMLIAGDGDYEPALEEILKAGWKVEIRFWASAMSRHLKTPDIVRKNKELKIVYKPLDNEYQNFTFCVGPNPIKNKSVFRIEREDMNCMRSEEIMKCYTELRLFCWWFETNDGLELYFNSKAQLERANRWMKKNFPNVKAWEIQDVPDELHELPN
ncbi:hypothetical protein C1645_740379 [Glomus cerebriforme]|uniref:Uncharacterized protein n=1 Tax=Glomus cerebriforme TaxID=658196 RepID=A0A397SSR9_9GLOM|nr:hypothetical protein C1645_740379 [Glomus cerebriforme]